MLSRSIYRRYDNKRCRILVEETFFGERKKKRKNFRIYPPPLGGDSCYVYFSLTFDFVLHSEREEAGNERVE